MYPRVTGGIAAGGGGPTTTGGGGGGGGGVTTGQTSGFPHAVSRKPERRIARLTGFTPGA